MPEIEASEVVIIDLGIGNLFSIARACEVVGLSPRITACAAEIERAAGLILPGVGAFGRAMQSLADADLLSLLPDYRASGRPMLGICLGMQLLLDGSEEFGQHQGLGFIPGTVRNLAARVDKKLPHIGWSPVYRRTQTDAWKQTLLDQFRPNNAQYFLHSFYADVQDQNDVLASSCYANFEFPAVLRRDNVSGCQFHPERSGSAGLMIYRQWAAQHGLSMRASDQGDAAASLHHTQRSSR